MSILRIGIISDTHGVLRPQAVDALAGVAHIIHAGDIGNAGILQQLGRVAPVAAIRGNNDTGAWAAAVPETLTITLGGVTFHVLHDVKQLAGETIPRAQVIVSGHSHRPSISTKENVMYVNPGSAGPRRFRLPVAVALIEIVNGVPQASIRELDISR
jgi:putative phosphoesterase